MRQGLNEQTSVGRCGRFKENAGNRTIALNTCVVNGITLFTYGSKSRMIGEPALGRDIRLKTIHDSWTGRTVQLTTRGENQTIDLRLTLPGPLFCVQGVSWGFDWAVGSSGIKMESLPDGRKFNAYGIIRNLPRLFLMHHHETPYVVVLSDHARTMEVTSHEHWWFSFAKPGARVMIVPVLDLVDIPRNERTARLWLNLVDAPPVRISESFSIENDTLTICGEAATENGRPSFCCPIPPMAGLLSVAANRPGPDSAGYHAFISMTPAVPILTTFMGPYSVVEGSNKYEMKIRMDWIRARQKFTRKVFGQLTPLPKELVYAGDMSWDEKKPMDSLMTHRVWDQLYEVLPKKTWNAIQKRAPLPTPNAFHKALVWYKEPITGRVWAKNRELFVEWGEISYDTDWYSGLTLAGLSRAARCGNQEVSCSARKLALAVRKDREELLAYYEIFHDWALCGSWTDPRGELYDYDCAHSGLDGMLGEAALRGIEGDERGRDWTLYLAGRTALSFMAVYELAVLHFKKGWFYNTTEILRPSVIPLNESEVFGLRILRERFGGVAQTPCHRLYGSWVTPAPQFPEYCALLKKYGPIRLLKRLASSWKRKCPGWYKDWLVYYVGDDLAAQIRVGAETASEMQEQREQAAVMYLVAHDTALRLLILDENPNTVEKRYKIPMPLSEQLLCRAGARLELSAIEIVRI